MANGQSISERFWSKVDVRGPDECWLWNGARFNHGYGRFYSCGKHRLAHRIAWELTSGAIQDGMTICHSCDVPLCCNPSHLWLGTQQDNIADMIRKGRDRKQCGEEHYLRRNPELMRGERNSRALLTEDQVRAIRKDYRSGQLIAKEYGVNPRTISAIKCGVNWRHVS